MGRLADEAAMAQAEIIRAETNNDAAAEWTASLKLAGVVEQGLRAVLESLQHRATDRESASSNS